MSSTRAGRLLVTIVATAAVATACATEAGEGTVDTEPAEQGPTGGAPASGAPQADAPSQDVYAIGETAHTSVFDVTVHQVVDGWESDNQFESPGAGHRFVAVEASLTNTEGEELETWSSLLGAELTDAQGRPWDVALAGSGVPTLDGDVGRGMTRRGWVVFEVGDDATGMTLRLKGGLTATGSLFDLGI
ncbi:MAG TPA: DUF4352 domain-containing protein [Acidimicrobiales bacterium]